MTAVLHSLSPDFSALETRVFKPGTSRSKKRRALKRTAIQRHRRWWRDEGRQMAKEVIMEGKIGSMMNVQILSDCDDSPVYTAESDALLITEDDRRDGR